MSIFTSIIIFCWFIFFGYWIVSAIGVKRNVKGSSLWQNLAIRFGVILILFLLVHTPIFTHLFQHQFKDYFRQMRYNKFSSSNYVFDSIGSVLTVVGVSFAIWARMRLGRNWGMPMSIKEKPDLITTGPYAYVRHPIYTGMLTAMIGSAFVNELFWIFFIVSGIYFFYSIREEEKLMRNQFPSQYSAYKKRTKKLIPFLY